jgi:type II secretion system protein N
MALTPRTQRILLAVYILSAAAVFLYIGFPSEALRAHVAHRLSAGLPGLNVSVAGVQPSLPAGLALRGVRIGYAEQPLAVFDRLRVQPELTSILQPKTIYSFEGSAGSGSISGRAEIDASGEKPKTSLNARISGILLQQMPVLQNIYGSRLSGRLEGSFSVNEAGVLSGKLILAETQVELTTPVFDQKSFTFRTADADIAFQNRTLLLRNGRLKGNEMDAEVTGSIALGPNPGAGTLNLNGRLTPHPAFLARVEGSLHANLLRRRTAIPFRVTGPLEAPGFSLN